MFLLSQTKTEISVSESHSFR